MKTNCLVYNALDPDGFRVGAIFEAAMLDRQLTSEPWSIKEFGGDVYLRLFNAPDEYGSVVFTSAELRAFKLPAAEIRREIGRYVDSVLQSAA